MASEASARAEILRRVRAANGGTATGEAAAAAWEGIARGYRRSADRDREAVLELLEDRLRDYDANTSRSTWAGLGEAIAVRVAERGEPRMIVPPGFPMELLLRPEAFAVDEGFGAGQLDGFGGVLTMAALAIAETGTLVLQNVPGQGRRAATLVPDYHLCVVHVDDVVQSVPEGMERLARTSTLPTTFVSGPSATADIEMTRIKGVHGPRFLDVILYS